jgi:SAM-dependent methyltransferase
MTDLGLELFAAVVVGVAAVVYFVFASFVFGAGYQPTGRSAVTRMLDLARVGPQDRVIDLGAGTGAILFRAARERGAKVVGVEVEPIRLLILRARRVLGGDAGRIEIRWGNLFDVDLRSASVVTCFLWPGAMERLRPRFEEQLAPGTRIVSHWHPIPGWSPVTVDRLLHVYLYEWPGRSASAASAPISAGSEPVIMEP